MSLKRKKRAGQDDAFSRILDSAAETEKQNTEAKPAKGKKKGRKLKRAALVAAFVASFFLLLFCGLGLWGYFVSASDYNFPNISLDGIAVGGLTQEATAAQLEKNGWDERVDGEMTVNIPGDVSFKLGYVSSGARYSAEKAAEAAYDYGRSANVFKNLVTYVRCYFIPTELDLSQSPINENYILSNMERGVKLMERATARTGHSVDMENAVLTMVKGAGAIHLDEQALYMAIVQALQEGQEEMSGEDFVLPVERPDFDKLYDELAVEPQDASFDEYFNVIPEVIGCSFDVKAAEKLWDAAAMGEEIKIPLTVTKPEVDSEALRGMLFRDKLGGQTTYYTWSSANRIGNIRLAAEKINGYIMLPGDVFSFNETVGQRTEEAGFRLAGAYNDGQVVEAIGGGICQVSSTLYCAQMFSQLKTTNRVNHYFKVDYLDYGLDATVSWKNPDYKFTNSREYPVKIVAFLDEENSALTVEIWGTDVDGSYVKVRHSSEPVYDEKWTNTLIGYTVRAYRDIYDANGNVINTVSEPGGVYYFHDEDIDWPAEKEKAEQDVLAGALDVLEQHEQEVGVIEGEGYLFDPDEYTGGYDIYA